MCLDVCMHSKSKQHAFANKTHAFHMKHVGLKSGRNSRSRPNVAVNVHVCDSHAIRMLNA